MKEKKIVTIAATGLLTGCVLGMAGSIIPGDTFRNLAWAAGSAGIILASVLLSVFYFRRSYDTLAAGFIILAIGEAVVFSSCATNLDENFSSFGAGSLLWALAIAVLSLQKFFPLLIRLTGMIGAILFAVASILILTGEHVNPLTKPLPYFAYPFYAATLVGWAWTILRKQSSIA